MQNQVQLITYANRLGGGGGIRELQSLLNGSLRGLFGGVHLLPFFHKTDGADAGFDPIDHREVDERLGSWADVKELGSQFELTADLIVNHISSESSEFRDYLAHGATSPYRGMFLSYDDVFPAGASEVDLASIYRPRPGLPFTAYTLRDGTKRLLWTTFTPRQVDLNVRHPTAEAYLESVLDTFARHGVTLARLDAAGYAVKEAGSRCFLIPETYAVIEKLREYAATLGIEVFVEAHAHHRHQVEIASHVDWVYDFALPPLILHALFSGSAAELKSWLEISPRNAVTVLDTHDGIGVIDVAADPVEPKRYPGLLSDDDLDRLVETIHANSRGESRAASGAAALNLDLYQVNCTYYDALGRDDRDYLTARAIQFFAPGVPQVYYVGLLAGENDLELLRATGVGRDINRQYFSAAQIDEALQKPVVLDLLQLIRFRNGHPSFGGTFELVDSGHAVLRLRWSHNHHWSELEVDFAAKKGLVRYSHQGGERSLSLARLCDSRDS